MKKKIIALLIISLLTVGPINIQATFNKDSTEINHSEIIDTDEPTICTGTIHGEVGNSHGVYAWTTCPFALVTTGIRRTRCNFDGEYELSCLTLNREYKVTAHYLRYKETEYVTLTKENPVKKIFFDMYESKPKNIVPKENNPKLYGLIFGFTGGVFDHANWVVRYAKLTFENRNTRSGYFGFYVIRFLELDKTYTITSRKEGYYDRTHKITLTIRKPIQMVNFFMEILDTI
jgi:hypothetical protein